MLQEAGIQFDTPDIFNTSFIEIDNVDTSVVCEVFKQFISVKFDCSYFDDSEQDFCLEWKDECVLFECHQHELSGGWFSFSFRRAFGITFLPNDVGSNDKSAIEQKGIYYSDIITCELTFEPNDVLKELKSSEIIFPPYEDADFEEFLKIEQEYQNIIEKYRPRKLVLEYSD